MEPVPGSSANTTELKPVPVAVPVIAPLTPVTSRSNAIVTPATRLVALPVRSNWPLKAVFFPASVRLPANDPFLASTI